MTSSSTSKQKRVCLLFVPILISTHKIKIKKIAGASYKLLLITTLCMCTCAVNTKKKEKNKPSDCRDPKYIKYYTKHISLHYNLHYNIDYV